MLAGMLGVCIYFITFSWTTCSGPTYFGWHAWSMHIFYCCWMDHLHWSHICWLECMECAYISSLLAGLLIAGPHISAGMLGAHFYFIALGWTTCSGPTYMSAGMLGACIIIS